MYKIGEFSLLNKVTIKTLRYYDEIGLFKPTIVDRYTGYRYYHEDQQAEFDKIKKFKDLGFSLEEIKKLKETNDQEVVKEKLYHLMNESNELQHKIIILSNMLRGKFMEIEFRPYNEKYKIGKRLTLKTRDFDKELQEIREALDLYHIPRGRIVLCNFELGYTKEDIDVFLGYEINREDIPEDLHGLEIISLSKTQKMLVGTSESKNLETLYSNIIKYAHERKLQIRGFFTEVYEENNVEIYVDAYNLDEENEDYIEHLSAYETTDEIDEELVGTYKIREILPCLKYMFNINKQKSTLDTKFSILKLNKDHTTNYDEIKWNKKELILTCDDKQITLPLYKYHYKDKKYIRILMNESYEYYKSQKPMEYLYEEI